MLKHLKKFAFLIFWANLANAAPPFGFRPPPFMGGMPGRVQMQSIVQQRHQSKTLLYRKAIEELRRNPKAADIPTCTRNIQDTNQCLPTQKIESIPANIINTPVSTRRALLIGNEMYSGQIPRLETPIDDVETIAMKLQERFDFKNVNIVKNATKAKVVAAMATLAKEAQPGDSVFIFYAGHGYLMDDTGIGYWIPIDATVDTAKQWISNQDISKFLHAIPARQIILISDSCFSGTLTKESQISQLLLQDPTQILTKRSVIAFSSGGDEPVSDEGKDGHSVFAWHLSNTLNELHGTTLGYNLFNTVKHGVIKEYPQTPQYGAVISAGHQPGGEYLFTTTGSN